MAQTVSVIVSETFILGCLYIQNFRGIFFGHCSNVVMQRLTRNILQRSLLEQCPLITDIFNPKTVVDACQLGKLLLDIEEVRKDLDLGVEDD